MFKRLRNRILLLNMSIITALILTLLATIYLSTYNRIERENQELLSMVSRRDFFTSAAVTTTAGAEGGVRLTNTEQIPWATGSFIEVSGQSEAPFSISSYALRDRAAPALIAAREIAFQPAQTASMIRLAPVDLSHSFHVIMNNEGEVFRINSYSDLTEEECSEAATAALQSGQTTGRYKLSGRALIYNVEPLDKHYIVSGNGDSLILTSIGSSSHRVTFLDVTASQNTLTQLLTTELAVGAVGLIFIFVISFYFAQRAIAPIAETWEHQKQFLADASHELKTPIAIINANSDALLAGGDETVASQRVWIDYIKAETARMGGLVNNLLDLARAEDLTVAPTQEEFDLSELATDAVLSMEAVAFERGLTLDSDLQTGLQVTACREDLGRVLLILLDNAVKYTEPGGRITVRLYRERRQTVFSVHNSGAGIPEEILPRLFDRFFRADQSRNHDTGSFGLGLSIAKSIVEREGGTITATSAPNEGATFTVEL